MRNPGCWARKLDDCEEKLTADHLVSVNAWPGETREQRLKTRIAFTKGRAGANGQVDTSRPGGFSRAITVNTLTAKVLCKAHNPRLARDVDSAAGVLTTAIERFRDTMHRRWIPRLRYDPVRFDVDGPRVERWFIKTLITITAQYDLPIGSPDAEPNTPTDELVDIVYGLREASGHVGLSAAAAVGMDASVEQGFSFMPWHRWPPNQPEREYIAGCLAEYRGFKFVLSIDAQPIPMKRLNEIAGWEGLELVTPLREINTVHSNVALRFHWPEHRYRSVSAAALRL